MVMFILIRDSKGDVHATEMPSPAPGPKGLVRAASEFLNWLGWFDDGERMTLRVVFSTDAGAARLLWARASAPMQFTYKGQ